MERSRHALALSVCALCACAIVDPSIESPVSGDRDAQADDGSAGASNPQRDAAAGSGRGGASGGATAGASGSAGPDDAGGPGGGGGSSDPQAGAGGMTEDGGAATSGTGAGGMSGSSAGSGGMSGSGSGGAGSGGMSGSGGAGSGGTSGTGGTAGSAGTGGTAGTAPPDPPGESGCYTRYSDRLVCEGFEGDLADPWYTIEVKGGVASETTAPTRMGEGALAASVQAGGDNAWVGRAAFQGRASGKLYLRSYVYVAGNAPLEAVVIHGLSQEPSPFGGVSIVLKDSGVEVDLHPAGAGVSPRFIRANPPVVLTRDTWHCIQFEVGISATQGSVLLRVDGRIAAQSSEPLVTLPSSGYNGISAGIVYTDPDQQAIQVFVDELIADDKASIPCDLTRR